MLQLICNLVFTTDAKDEYIDNRRKSKISPRLSVPKSGQSVVGICHSKTVFSGHFWNWPTTLLCGDLTLTKMLRILRQPKANFATAKFGFKPVKYNQSCCG
jgi:hypothetical protein